jgi:CMP-N-acetylneuraminic acid synthetase
MKIVALVPARSGSGGLKNKNIILLSGYPVISYSINAALNCPEINKCYLNSDSKKYLKIGEKFGAEPFLRPNRLAKNNTSMKQVVKHFIATLEKRGEFYDAVILLSPTYPLRTAQNVRNFIKHYKKEKQHPLVSIKEPSTHPYLCYKKNKNNHIKSIFNLNGNNIYRRQQYPEYYEFTHHLCIFPTNLIYKLNAKLLCN